MKMNKLPEDHKLARIKAVRASFNSKGVVYLDKKLNLIQEHNFYGESAIKEKFVFANNSVKVYDAKGTEIEKHEGKKPKSKDSSKLRKSTDEKAS